MFFINRPIFATVISIVIILVGVISLQILPVDRYPDITPPQVSVSTTYPGANAETVAQTVAAPLEQQINGVPNMIYMYSTSDSTGALTISANFSIGSDPDQATIDVNNRVQQVLASLPDEVKKQGITVQKKSSSILMIISIVSPNNSYDLTTLSNYALVNVLDDIKRVDGVGDAKLIGSRDYSMRVWLKPDKMAQLKVAASDVINAINEQNNQYPVGRFGAPPFTEKAEITYTINSLGRLSTAEEFENIILRSNPDGSKLRLKDIARVELGANSYDTNATVNNKEVVIIPVYLQPGANALAVKKRVDQKMEELKAHFPEDIDYKIPFDTTTFITISIEEVIKTLFEAIILVFLIVYLFLQNFRATLIPTLAVPVSIIGTFAGMYILGFSINLLTLFGLILAIGIVVDDAIVVLENVERIMADEGLSPKEATAKTMQEVTAPVLAIVLVLCAVYLPITFLGGLSGVMYKQFAVTIVISVILSGIVALTLTPALCALILKNEHKEESHKGFFAWFNRIFLSLTNVYLKVTKFFITNYYIAIALFIGVIALVVFLFINLPSTLVPEEDQGYVVSAMLLPNSMSLAENTNYVENFNKLIIKHPAVENSVMMIGSDLLSGATKSSSTSVYISMKPWDDRKTEDLSPQSLIKYIFKNSLAFPRGLILAFNPPPISGMSTTGGFELYVQNRGDGDFKKMSVEVKKLIEALSKRKEIGSINTTFSANTPQIFAKLDREKTKAYQVSISDVYTAMSANFGGMYINDFNKLGRTFKVNIQADGSFRAHPEDIKNVYVKSQTGQMVPLSALITLEPTTGTDVVNRFNIFPAIKVTGAPADGYTSGTAMNVIEEVAKEVLPKEYSISWSGSSYQEKLVASSSTKAFILGLLFVFLILAAKYERWRLSVVVITIIPFAVLGALIANYLRGLANDIYFQVAIVTLIGLASKNSILIVEFAALQMKEGKSIVEAAIEGFRLRFRPIVMTSMAFIAGCFPLAIARGAGAASRHSIGTAVIGGMILATYFAIIFIPTFFSLIMRMKFSKSDKE